MVVYKFPFFMKDVNDFHLYHGIGRNLPTFRKFLRVQDIAGISLKLISYFYSSHVLTLWFNSLGEIKINLSVKGNSIAEEISQNSTFITTKSYNARKHS